MSYLIDFGVILLGVAIYKAFGIVPTIIYSAAVVALAVIGAIGKLRGTVR